jgi:hypothetical protein
LADPNLGEVAATVFENVVARDPADNVFTSQALLNILKQNGGFVKEDGGSQFEEPLMYSENTTTKFMAEMDMIDTTRVPVFDAARFPQRIVGSTIVFSQLEKERASGDHQKIELVSKKVENGKNSMWAFINRGLYADGSTANSFGGLALLVSSTPTTGTVGGINRANFPFWRNRQTAGTKTTNAFDNLRGAMRTLYNSCSKGAAMEHPEWYLFDQTSMEGYESTLTVNERFTDKTKGDGGFANDALLFKGAKVLFDEDMPSATGFVLQPRNLKFRYFQWCKAFPEVVPANQLIEVTKLMTIGNMTLNNPRRLGVITAIS